MARGAANDLVLACWAQEGSFTRSHCPENTSGAGLPSQGSSFERRIGKESARPQLITAMHSNKYPGYKHQSTANATCMAAESGGVSMKR